MSNQAPTKSKVTIYFSIEEGWIHMLTFGNGAETQAITDCISHWMPYSESQMRYLRARSESEPTNIYIFQAKRDVP